ncbi:MAG: hypothetical protein GYA45_11675 [Pelolinea sp.]|nr:hypothetical protein [Pelolinea sp.]
MSYIRKIEAQIVGESYDNEDGTSRQAEIKNFCKPGIPVKLIREPNNKYDKKAIGVWVRGKGFLSKEHDHQVGYLNKEQAAEFAPILDAGHTVEAAVKKVVGGTADKPHYGLIIEIFKTEEK